MEANFQAIKGLYQDEINAYKSQLELLKAENKRCDEKNSCLVQKVQQLQDLIEKANVANKDLHTAFEHVREENLKLQLHTPNNQQDNNRVRPSENEMALEVAQEQYINLAQHSISWVSDKDRLTQRVKFLERECERYTRDNVTLGKQVRHLLKTLEEERGMIIRRSTQSIDNGLPVTSSDIIDNHLVTFESIEQLQQKNQELLSLVKELSKREEEREIQVENEDIIRLNGDIEALKSQLEAVKNDREQIMSAFNTMIKERDLFKILLSKTKQVEQMTPEIFQRMVSIACSSGPAITNELDNTQDKDAHIVDLKAMISKLEHELSELRNDFELARVKNEEEIKLKTDLLEKAHIKILDESHQTEVLKERNELLETNIKLLTKEFDENRTKTQKLIFELDQLNKTNKHLNELLDDEKQRRQSELSTILNEIQSKCDLRAELQLKLTDAEKEIKELNSTIREYELNSKKSELKIQSLMSEIQKLQAESNALRSQIQEASSKMSRESKDQIAEFQRLRDIERAARLEVMKQLHKLSEENKPSQRKRKRIENENISPQGIIAKVEGRMNDRDYTPETPRVEVVSAPESRVGKPDAKETYIEEPPVGEPTDEAPINKELPVEEHLIPETSVKEPPFGETSVEDIPGEEISIEEASVEETYVQVSHVEETFDDGSNDMEYHDEESHDVELVDEEPHDEENYADETPEEESQDIELHVEEPHDVEFHTEEPDAKDPPAEESQVRDVSVEDHHVEEAISNEPLVKKPTQKETRIDEQPAEEHCEQATKIVLKRRNY